MGKLIGSCRELNVIFICVADCILILCCSRLLKWRFQLSWKYMLGNGLDPIEPIYPKSHFKTQVHQVLTPTPCTAKYAPVKMDCAAVCIDSHTPMIHGVSTAPASFRCSSGICLEPTGISRRPPMRNSRTLVKIWTFIFPWLSFSNKIVLCSPCFF